MTQHSLGGGGDAEPTLARDAHASLRSSDDISRTGLVRDLILEGRPLRIRPVRPDDVEGIREMLEACSCDDVRQRFNGAMRSLTPALAASLTQIDYDRQLGLVAEADGALLGMGQLCLAPEGERAEFALLVRSDRQHHGIGSRLLEALLDYAAERGLTEVWGETSLENGRMLEVTREHDFAVLPAADRAEVRLTRRITPAARGIRAAT